MSCIDASRKPVSMAMVKLAPGGMMPTSSMLTFPRAVLIHCRYVSLGVLM